ncbi:MAG: Fe2+-dependent dioxygenase [Hyphomonadaceae bacterium]|nr:MAG: putative hydroxylase [Caulobacteraceae bacterium]MBT9444751.1 Fe2+-dependent dioxygenase [Hyphomonadaceae bacterium]TPW05966.1 MAG: putative hydroxylase [Alphaproteobacteria bacterium]
MILEIKDLLTPEELIRLQGLAKSVRFVDGRATNPGFGQKVNLQADPNDAATAEVSKLVNAALARSREFVDFALPKKIAPPLLARYTPGMQYGPHADAALLPMPKGPLRSDVSATVFLNDPATYEGGELVLHFGARSIAMKAPAGGAIVYPSTTLHEVAPVRSGERLVVITFIESFVVDEHHRSILFELGEVSALEGEKMHWASRMRLEVVRQNLTRRWSSGQ